MFDTASYAFNPYAIPTLVAAAAILLLGVAVLGYERGSRESASFFVLTAAISWWLFGFSCMYMATDRAVALTWARIAYLGVPAIAPAVYHFTVQVLRLQPLRRGRVVAAWLLAAAFAAWAGLGDGFIDGLYRYWWGYYPRFGAPGVPYLVFFLGVLGLSLYEYGAAYRRSRPGRTRRRIFWFALAFAAGYVALLDYVAVFGVSLYPFGYLAIFAFLLISAWTVRRYHLVDLTPQFAADEIIATMADPLIVCDDAGTIRFVNPAAASVLEYSPGELLGRPLHGLAAPDDDSARGLRGTLEKPLVRDEERLLRTRSGATIPASISASPLRAPDGSRVGTVLIARDIRERKRAEENRRRLLVERIARSRAEAAGRWSAFLADAGAALASSLELEATLDHLVQLAVPRLADWCAVDLVDVGGRVRRVAVAARDERLERRLREAASPGAAAGAPDEPVDRVLRTARPELWPSADAMHERTGGTASRDRIASLGTRSYMAVPLVARGRTLGVIGLARTRATDEYGEADLTHATQLADRAALAVDNARLYEEAQRAIRARDEVLGIVSHDLKDPLNTIVLSTALMLDHALSDADRREQIGLIRRAAERMRRLIADLLDVARVEAGRALSLEPRRNAISPLLDEACEPFRAKARESEVRLECRMPPGLPDVLVDRDRVLQAISNLLGNAIKFTPPGGRVEVRATAEPEAAPERVRIAVSDSGPGIDREDLPRLFQPFWQAGRTARLGTGLGLPIAKGIVEAHGGEIGVDTRPGRGSTFWFTIPAWTAEAERAAD